MATTRKGHAYLAPRAERGRQTVYAGVEPAGLFRSDDRGETWTHVDGLREHPASPNGNRATAA